MELKKRRNVSNASEDSEHYSLHGHAWLASLMFWGLKDKNAQLERETMITDQK